MPQPRNQYSNPLQQWWDENIEIPMSQRTGGLGGLQRVRYTNEQMDQQAQEDERKKPKIVGIDGKPGISTYESVGDLQKALDAMQGNLPSQLDQGRMPGYLTPPRDLGSMPGGLPPRDMGSMPGALREAAPRPEAIKPAWSVNYREGDQFRTQHFYPQGAIGVQTPKGGIGVMGTPEGNILNPQPQQQNVIDMILNQRFGATPPVLRGNGMVTTDINWERDRDDVLRDLLASSQEMARNDYSLRNEYGNASANTAAQRQQAQQLSLLDLIKGDRANELGYAQEGGRRLNTVLTTSGEAEKNAQSREELEYRRSPQGQAHQALQSILQAGKGLDPSTMKAVQRVLEEMERNRPKGAIGVQKPTGGIGVGVGADQAKPSPSSKEEKERAEQDAKAQADASIDDRLAALNPALEAQRGKAEMIDTVRNAFSDDEIAANKGKIKAKLQEYNFGDLAAEDETSVNPLAWAGVNALTIPGGGPVPEALLSVPSWLGAPTPDVLGEMWSTGRPWSEKMERLRKGQQRKTNNDIIRVIYDQPAASGPSGKAFWE